MDRKPYIDVTQEAGRAFFTQQREGSVVMLNLLKFNEIADYSKVPHLAPEEAISGEAAYQLYMDHTLPFLEEAGSEVLFYGKGGAFLIGPENEDWDVALLVRHASVPKFMEFATKEAYLAGAGHRTAALADSRLLPLEASKMG